VRRAPTIIAWLAALYTWWLYFRQMPFYNSWVNISISSMWLGVAYTASLLMVLSWDHRYGDPDFHYWMTWVRAPLCSWCTLGSAPEQRTHSNCMMHPWISLWEVRTLNPLIM